MISVKVKVKEILFSNILLNLYYNIRDGFKFETLFYI